MGTCLAGEWHAALSLPDWDTRTLRPSVVSAEIPNSEEKRNTLQLQLEHTCLPVTWALGTARSSGLSPQWLVTFPPPLLFNQVPWVFAGICLGSEREIREGGYRAATGFPRAQFSSDYWNVSWRKEGGPRDLVQVAPTINPAQLPTTYSLLH